MENKKTYKEAKIKCSHFDERASLVSPRSKVDLGAYNTHIERNGGKKPHWIGGHFDITKMDWVWSDGRMINWGNFGNSILHIF